MNKGTTIQGATMRYAVFVFAHRGSNPQVIGQIGKTTMSRRKARRLAKDVETCIRPGLGVEHIALTRFVRASLSQFGTVGGQ